MPPTQEKLRELIARTEESIAALEAELAEMKERRATAELQLSVLRRQLVELRRVVDTEGLTIEAKSGTTDTMDASGIPLPGARRSQGHISRKHKQHPFVQALARDGWTVGKFAESIGQKRTTVQSWYRTGEGAREIPRAVAEAIKERLKVPLSAWERIEPKA